MSTAEQKRQRAAYMREWRQTQLAKHGDVYLEAERLSYRNKVKANPDRYRAAAKRRTANYRKRRSLTITPEEREAHNAANRKRNKLYVARNLDRVRAMKRETARRLYWRDPQKAISTVQRRLYKLSEGLVTAAQWQEIKERFKHCCAYCGLGKKLEQDHVMPLSRGGQHTPENVVPACRTCNARKGNRIAA